MPEDGGLVTAGPGDELHCQSVDPLIIIGRQWLKWHAQGFGAERVSRGGTRMTPRGLVDGETALSVSLLSGTLARNGGDVRSKVVQMSGNGVLQFNGSGNLILQWHSRSFEVLSEHHHPLLEPLPNNRSTVGVEVQKQPRHPSGREGQSKLRPNIPPAIQSPDDTRAVAGKQIKSHR